MGLRNDQIDSATKRKFDLLRKKASQGAEVQGQEAQGALQRRFATLGNLKSGAAIKQQQLVGQKVGEAKANALEGIGVAQAGEEAQRAKELEQRDFAADQAKIGREFQSSERQASQKFGSDFQRSEREAGQKFGAEQAGLGRDFQEKIHGKDMAFKDQVFRVESGFKREQLNQASKEFELNKQITAFNSFAQALESDNFDQLKPALDGLGASMGVDTSQFQREEDKGFWGSIFDGVKKVYTPVTELF